VWQQAQAATLDTEISRRGQGHTLQLGDFQTAHSALIAFCVSARRPDRAPSHPALHHTCLRSTSRRRKKKRKAARAAPKTGLNTQDRHREATPCARSQERVGAGGEKRSH
jgi:hypothetical protein